MPGVAVLVGLVVAQAAWAPAALEKKVLIIGVDGCMPSAMAVANTPNLNALKATACFSDRAVTHPVTHSAACWTSMFTGVWGDKHGVNDPGNSFAGNRLDLYPNFMKRLEAVNSNLNTVAYTRWSGLVSALPGTDAITNYGTDAALTTSTCRLLTNGNPDVFYTILLDVDSAGHSYGWGAGVTNYVKAIETADARIGQMMSALTNRLTYTNEDWLVVLLSDHGQHDDPDVEKSRVTFHLFWGPSVARGRIWPAPGIVDVCASVLTHMEVPIDPAWNLDARIEGLPRPPIPYGTNLIFNGDAEWNSGTNNYTTNRGVAWWWDVSGATLGAYGSNTNFPAGDSPGPPERGRNFFLGGTASSFILQRIDLSDLAGDVDDPGVDYQLSGWFGGKGAEGDRAALVARFLDSAGLGLATNRVGDVSAADRVNLTGLLERSTNGTLPPGTRFVEFVLTNRMAVASNDASADNLAFVLTPRADSPFLVGRPQRTERGWAVEMAQSKTNRLYRLWRSADFKTWLETTEEIRGTGSSLLFEDSNAPTDRAFYRVGSRRP